jgi:hypothetical protein
VDRAVRFVDGNCKAQPATFSTEPLLAVAGRQKMAFCSCSPPVQALTALSPIINMVTEQFRIDGQMSFGPRGWKYRDDRGQTRNTFGNWFAAVAMLGGALLVATGPVDAQEWRSGSPLAGVTWPVSAYDWPDTPDGAKHAMLDASATAAGSRCIGEYEFNAWDLSGEDDPEWFRRSILISYEDAGWTLAQPVAAEGDVYRATKGGNEVLVWLNYDQDKYALALFTCVLEGSVSAATASEPGAETSGQAAIVDAPMTLFVKMTMMMRGLGYLALLIALVCLIVGFRQRKRAAAASSWAQAPAVILSSRVETGTTSDADGDETTWYRPQIHYSYTHNGVQYEGQRLRFGKSKTSAQKRVEEAVAKYPAGAQVTVRVNPQKPSEATLEAEMPKFRSFLPIAIVFALGGAVLLTAHSALGL